MGIKNKTKNKPRDSATDLRKEYCSSIASELPQLVEIPNWVAYRSVPKADGKTDKVPINPNTGKKADSTDSSTWSDFKEAVYYCINNLDVSGLGFMFGEKANKSGVVGVDLDNCLYEDGTLAAGATLIVKRMDTYTEISPSDSGLHLLAFGEKPGLSCKKGHFEIYDSERFFTITGRHLPLTPNTLEKRNQQIAAAYYKYWPPKNVAVDRAADSPTLSDDELLAKAFTAENGEKFTRLWKGDISGYPSHSEADLALCSMLAFWTSDSTRTDRLFRQSDLFRDKWDEKRGEMTYGERTVATAAGSQKEHYTSSQVALSDNGQGPQDVVADEPSSKKPTVADFYIAFKTLGYAFKMSELDDSIECNDKRMSPGIEATIVTSLYDWGFRGKQRGLDVMTRQAYENRYHPIKDYFNGLEWSGRDSIAALTAMLDYGESEDMGPIFVRRWLIGAVAKVIELAQNFMLVFDGPQGLGKSYLVRWLCPLDKYFIEGGINTDDKDSLLRLASKWIWEVGELQATTRKADREALKDFVSRREVTVRPAYGRYDIVKPALASLVGTINESGAGFLSDPTGNRRFAVVNLAHIDWDYTKLDPADIWAQAVHLYRNGELWNLTPEEQQRQREINAGYDAQSPLEELFFSYYEITESEDWMPAAEIISYLEIQGLKGNQRVNMMELAGLMQKVGVEKKRAWVWVERSAESVKVRLRSYRGVRQL